MKPSAHTRVHVDKPAYHMRLCTSEVMYVQSEDLKFESNQSFNDFSQDVYQLERA